MDLITTPEAMHNSGQELAKHSSHILLFGDMGSGKTTLTKGCVEQRGTDPNNVQSPTYTYVHIYDERILHIDMRRIEQEAQFFELGILDMIDTYPYVIIERPKWTETYRLYPWKQVFITQTPNGRKVDIL